MSIEVNLQDPNNASLPLGLEALISDNNQLIETALLKSLNRESSDGANFMLVDLDMNGFRVLNASEPKSPTDLVRLKDVSVIKAGEFRKNTITGSLEYKIDGYDSWEVFYTLAELRGETGNDGEDGEDGLDGTGIGDLIAANNLSDVDNSATALANLGAQPLIPSETYAPFNDSRFTSYDVDNFNDGASTVSEWGKLHYKLGTGAATLTFDSPATGCVNTVAVNRASGDVTIQVTGLTLVVAGETSARPIVVAPGGMVTVTVVSGSDAFVSGSGIKVS